MRHVLIAATAALGLAALPAFAATQDSTRSSTTNAAPQSTAQIQQDLSQNLSKAGYSDIHIMPGSFLVHAKDKQGQPVEMMISPNSVLEVAAMPPASGSNSTTTQASK